MIKKIIAFAISASMLFAAVPAFAAGSAPSKWAAADVKSAIAKGIVPEGIQSNYQKPITRGEFAELLVRSVISETNKSESGKWTLDSLLERVSTKKNFTDTNSKYVKAAYIMGAINGLTNTTFGPNKNVTREEAATMIMNHIHYNAVVTDSEQTIASIKDIKAVSKWAEPAVVSVVAGLHMNGNNGKFDPKGLYTREQAISMMVRMMKNGSLEGIKARGEIPMRAAYFTMKYEVSDNEVKVGYPTEDFWSDDPVVWDAAAVWETKKITRDLIDPTVAQATIIYLFNKFYLDEEVVANATYANKSVHVDYQYMTLDTLGKDYMMKFTFKPMPGYSTVIGAFSYGYPRKNVIPKYTVR